MIGERLITVSLGPDEQGEDVKVVIAAQQVGPALVADDEIVARLGMVTDSVERVGRQVLESLKRIAPTKASVELGFGIAFESNGLVALLGKGKGEATITVTLEWEPSTQNGRVPS